MNLNSGWDEGPSDILEDIQRGIEAMKMKTGYTDAVLIPKAYYDALSEAEKRNIIKLVD